MGLYHTFQGGCNGQRRFCLRYACRSLAGLRLSGRTRHLRAAGGLDPIENFMDYTDDACMFEFTTGQDARMDSQFTTYRLQGAIKS